VQYFYAQACQQHAGLSAAAAIRHRDLMRKVKNMYKSLAADSFSSALLPSRGPGSSITEMLSEIPHHFRLAAELFQFLTAEFLRAG
jgi:hypothetical protein